MSEFATPLDIVNRAYQILGRNRIGSLDAADSGANEASFAYDKLRTRELRRNLWTFSARKTVLRPITLTTQKITFAAWDSATTYSIGDIVTYQGQIWVSMTAANLDNTPTAVQTSYGTIPWDRYFGATYVDKWTADGVSPDNQSPGYGAGELAYMITGAGTIKVYLCLEGGNDNQPDEPDAWLDNKLYSEDAVVELDGTNYQSLVNYNVNNSPDDLAPYWTATVTEPEVSGSWREVTDFTLSTPILTWPAGAGPLEDTRSRNLFPLPNGYLRKAHQAPAQGSLTYLGAPTGLMMTDWEYNGPWLISAGPAPTGFRFGADVLDVSTFDPMFCEGLAGAIAVSQALPLTQDRARLGEARVAYKQAIIEARIVNAIEQGVQNPPMDEWISVRY